MGLSAGVSKPLNKGKLKRFTLGRVIGLSWLLSGRAGAVGGYDNAGP